MLLSTSPLGRQVRSWGGLRAPVAIGLDVLRVLLDVTIVPLVCFPHNAVLLVVFVAPLSAAPLITGESTRIITGAVVTVTGLI